MQIPQPRDLLANARLLCWSRLPVPLTEPPVFKQMADHTPDVDRATGSQTRPLFGFHTLDENLQRLRQEAMPEIVMLQPRPAEKKPGLQRYDPPKSCVDMYEILQNQANLVQLAGLKIGPRVREPQVFQLSEGHSAEIPEGYLGRAILLSQYEARFRMRRGNYVSQQEIWKPDQELYFDGRLVACVPYTKFSLAIYELVLV
ncbi:hypothetical protein FOXG_14482 [Fusarium oxysporum f. sp. lycopersici 4287]|uniref:Uncharacterized protein n=1 Tax=Fusarium oxysporum f. sp. lycopersici (strain 4287 / CBS 123668 / FGSC 9935 / NRRL 34936) TaxID=426428 RepID=A0A0J9WTV5_FUSO4|nr:hypothetical protein FOXG_14482 [Fusarium oxysporum f. sp. lycopersici 4287]KNB16692.1 hypothetical protein FOXG_14482 [Fusarium oxysporum f. sp. lycopersici 4287]